MKHGNDPQLRRRSTTAKIDLIALRHFLVKKLIPNAAIPVKRKATRMRDTCSQWRCFLTTAIVTTALAIGAAANAADTELAPLPLKLPLPTLKGTPEDLPQSANVEPLTDKLRPAFFAPKGARNVALNKKVTASDKNPITGQLSQITDGTKEAYDNEVVEMRKGVQWVQVDLGGVCEVYAVVVWHDHRLIQACRNVVVQAADDPDFIDNVTTLFNNDTENLAGLGIGFDKQYFETAQGKLIPVKDKLKTRYLRFYSRGSNSSALNCYQEIEVYGQPVKR